MPRQRSLTTDAVVEAALAVVDRSGAAAMTMRAVAAELSIAPMSLYGYVKSREHLEERVVEHLFAQVDVTVPAGDWKAQIAALVGRVRATFAAHSQVVLFGLPHRVGSEPGLRLSNSVVGVLSRSGFSPGERAIIVRSVMAFLLGSFQLEHFGAVSGHVEQVLATLPADPYPFAATGTTATGAVAVEDEFDRGLGFLLNGVEASLTKKGPQRRANGRTS